MVTTPSLFPLRIRQLGYSLHTGQWGLFFRKTGRDGAAWDDVANVAVEKFTVGKHQRTEFLKTI